VRLQVVDACVVALAERLDLREIAALDRRDFPAASAGAATALARAASSRP